MYNIFGILASQGVFYLVHVSMCMGVFFLILASSSISRGVFFGIPHYSLILCMIIRLRL